jgi:hypothetical protein
MSLSLTLVLATLASSLVAVPWTLIFLCTRRVRLYYLTNRCECSRIQRRISSWSSHLTDGNKSYGYAIGQWYGLHLSFDERRENYCVYMIATPETYERLTKDPSEQLVEAAGRGHNSFGTNIDTVINSVDIYERTGTYANPWFRKRVRKANDTPTAEQQYILESILKYFNERKTATVLLHGPPGTGKSMLGLLLAANFSSSFCNTLRPWQPGDSIGSLYSEIEPTAAKPLVVVFDEIDSALVKIHTNTIKSHDVIPISVQNKQGWNHMLDEIQRFMFPYLIVILTTNVKPEDICDQSFIRPGRINLIFELKKTICKLH